MQCDTRAHSWCWSVLPKLTTLENWGRLSMKKWLKTALKQYVHVWSKSPKREICLFRNDDKPPDLREKQTQLEMWQNRRKEEKRSWKSCTNDNYTLFYSQHVKWIFYFLAQQTEHTDRRRTIDLSTVPLPHPFTFLQWNHLCVKCPSGRHPFPTSWQQIVKTKLRQKRCFFLQEPTGTCLLWSIVMINSSDLQCLSTLFCSSSAAVVPFLAN